MVLDVVKLHLAILNDKSRFAAFLCINTRHWSRKASEKLNCLLSLYIVGTGGRTKGYLDH